jgi:hypothetical protein
MRLHSASSVPLWAIGWGMLICILTTPALADQPEPTKDQIKGAYLLNFASLVRWPPESYASLNDPTIIGIPAGDSLMGVLGSALANRRPGGRPIKLLSVKSIDQVKQCHVLFVREAGNLDLFEVVAAARNLPVLTVSDIGSFTSLGGTIWLFEDKGKIGFDINRRVERRSRLRIDSRLLRLARNVLE